MSILEEFLDNKITCLMYDGRYVIGILRSFDKFHNLTLEKSYEKLIHGNYIAKRSLGVQIIRGENLVLFGSDSLKNEEKNYKLVDFDKLLKIKEIKQ